MSIKIYNGYIINIEDKSLLGIQKFCKRIKPDFERKKNELVNSTMAYLITDKIDSASLKKIRTQNIFYETIEELNSRIKINYNNFSSEIILIPVAEKILALFYGDIEFEDIWKSINEVEDYHYQNSTDQPEEINNFEWEIRKKDWELALPGNGIPIENGFSFSLTDNKILYIKKEDISKFIPEFKYRCIKKAKELLTLELLGDKKDISPSDYIRTRLSILESKRLEEIIKEVSLILPKKNIF
jgi:hypothetical protein